MFIISIFLEIQNLIIQCEYPFQIFLSSNYEWNLSSAGLERCFDRAEVGGSNPLGSTQYLM